MYHLSNLGYFLLCVDPYIKGSLGLTRLFYFDAWVNVMFVFVLQHKTKPFVCMEKLTSRWPGPQVKTKNVSKANQGRSKYFKGTCWLLVKRGIIFKQGNNLFEFSLIYWKSYPVALLRLEWNKWFSYIIKKQIFLHFHVIQLHIFHATLDLSLEDLLALRSQKILI